MQMSAAKRLAAVCLRLRAAAAQHSAPSSSLLGAADAAGPSGRFATAAIAAFHSAPAAPLLARLASRGPAAAVGASPVTAAAALSAQLRWTHCSCPGLGDGSQPRKIVFEFDPNEVDRFIKLADAIEEEFPELVVEGNPDSDGRPGSFEVVTDDGRTLFSRFASSRFPNTQELLTKLRGTPQQA